MSGYRYGQPTGVDWVWVAEAEAFGCTIRAAATTESEARRKVAHIIKAEERKADMPGLLFPFEDINAFALPLGPVGGLIDYSPWTWDDRRKK